MLSTGQTTIARSQPGRLGVREFPECGDAFLGMRARVDCAVSH